MVTIFKGIFLKKHPEKNALRLFRISPLFIIGNIQTEVLPIGSKRRAKLLRFSLNKYSVKTGLTFF
jgi:hypothetical protein